MPKQPKQLKGKEPHRSPDGVYGDAAQAVQPFRNALQPLKKLLPVNEPPPQPVPTVVAQPPEPAPLRDEELLAIAMSGVKPMPRGPQRVAPAKPMPQALGTTRVPVQIAPPEMPHDLPDEPDWWSGDVDPALLWSLAGPRPWQRRVDVTACETTSLLKTLRQALLTCREQLQACLLVVHSGKGAPYQGALLRATLRGQLVDLTIGYMTANPTDGGRAGLYVWVRPNV